MDFDSFKKGLSTTSGILIAIIVILGLCGGGGCLVCLLPNILTGTWYSFP